MRALQGRVADVLPFSWVDGPGNRFVVFLQGCNLDCLACHNPHTIPIESTHSRVVGVDALVAELLPVAPFLSGVTVSGGEATLQAAFVRDFFAALAADERLAGLTRFIDSSGAAPAGVWDMLLPVADGVMLDLKALDPGQHRQLTGSDNEQVLASIRQVAASGKLHEVRLLLVPGVNDDPETLRTTAAWLLDVDPDIRIKVLGFRSHGVRARARQWPEAGPVHLERYRAELAAAGVRRLEVV